MIKVTKITAGYLHQLLVVILFYFLLAESFLHHLLDLPLSILQRKMDQRLDHSGMISAD